MNFFFPWLQIQNIYYAIIIYLLQTNVTYYRNYLPALYFGFSIILQISAKIKSSQINVFYSNKIE